MIKAITRSGHTNSYTSEVHEPAFEISREMLLINNEENKELSQKAFNAIKELSPRQKEIIYLKFNLDFSYEQISQIMHISYQAARNLLYQSIKIVKKIVAP